MAVFISREQFAKLGVAPAQKTLTLTLANTEYSTTVPIGTKRVIFGLRSGSYSFRYGWVTTETNFTVPAGAFRDVSEIHLDDTAVTTIYFICPDAAGEILEIEYWQ
jgi:hypothetical protein